MTRDESSRYGLRQRPCRPKLTVVIMAYNEVDSVRATIEELATVLNRAQVSTELLLVDDGSTDGTGPLADQLIIGKSTWRVIHHEENRGLGGVYRTGFREASGDYLTFFPADGQFPAEIIEQFLPLIEGRDLVLGYVPQRNDAITGRILSSVQRLLYRILLGDLPRFQGILLFRRALLESVNLVSTGKDWVVLMEFILRVVRAGAVHISVPTEVRPRTFGSSKVNNWRTVRSTLRHMLALRRSLRTGD
jgi:glycosyltransferase involved in cell wall biosynthesis